MFNYIHRLKGLVLALLGIATAVSSQVKADYPISLTEARQYFAEARAVCESDSGRLWGRSLCVPMMFVDRQSGFVVANESDVKGMLQPDSGVFVGKLPIEIGAANTAMDWEGKRWTMILWPLPANPVSRADLMMHECFHNIEPALNLDQSIPANAHLDTRDGRIWLRLEFAALAAALRQSGEERKTAIADALLFREHRRKLFPSAGTEENQMEMHEGLAQYTGHALCGVPRPRVEMQMSASAANLTNEQSVVANFAYWTGAAYGMLLDDYGAEWRSNLTSQSDFGQMLAKAAGVIVSTGNAEVTEKRAPFYDGDEIKADELNRENRHRERLQKYRQMFVEGATLQLPLQAMQYTYDPNNLFPLDSLGTVYPVMRVSDKWGILEVSDGALMASSWTMVTLTAPADTSARPVNGNGWRLELASGWTFVSGKRQGDLVLVPSSRK